MSIDGSKYMGRGKDIDGKFLKQYEVVYMPKDLICVKMMLRYLKKHGVDDVDGILSWLALLLSGSMDRAIVN